MVSGSLLLGWLLLILQSFLLPIICISSYNMPMMGFKYLELVDFHEMYWFYML